ncbi:MAG: DUF4430 domain-containing protein [Solirubrobacterales bacterium]
MSRGRNAVVAAALLLAALAATGCGLGPGADSGSVRLTVTHEFGAQPVLEKNVEVKESATVMRVLEGAAKISTRYGGGFVQSIDGSAGGERGGRFYDWLYFVDGLEASIGAADYPLRGGERIWWDYRDWTAASHVPAIVGSFPAPLSGGYGGRRHPVKVICAGGGSACGTAREALERAGVELADGEPRGAIRVLVGPWERLRSDPAAKQLAAGPAESGVYAKFEAGAGGERLHGLDPAAAEARAFPAATGLVAATRRFEAPPTWLVTGATPAAVRAAAAALEESKLRDHYAVAVEGDRVTPLPVGTG